MNIMKLDPYKHKEKYIAWKKSIESTGIGGINKENSKIILRYIGDMEIGINVSLQSKKGSRSYITLNNIKQRLSFLANLIESRLPVKCLTELTEEQIFQFFNDMRTGAIKRLDGNTYQSPTDYIRIFKAFWHWWQKVNKKAGKDVGDITFDLDTHQDKPKWVYLTENEVRQLCDSAKYNHKILYMFLFDTGVRSPTELMNIKVSDLYNDCKELQIRQETSKTFGRKIKLMLCTTLLREYIKIKGLQQEDYLFKISPTVTNKYLKRLAGKLFGDKASPAGAKYSQMTMYDFRHCSCCYWLPRYKSESALKYRFGWKKSDKIHYYSELLGMKDTISEDDMLLDLTKTEIEKRLEKSEKDKEILSERLISLEKDLNKLKQQSFEVLKNFSANN